MSSQYRPETKQLFYGKRTLHIVTPNAAKTLFRQIAEDYAPKGARILTADDDRLYIEVERAWAVSATVSIDLRYENLANSFEVTDKDGKTYRCYPVKVEAEINWGGTGRTIAQAAASVKLYQELIEFASLAQSILDEFDFTKIIE